MVGGKSNVVPWLGTRQREVFGVWERRTVFLQILRLRVVRHFGYPWMRERLDTALDLLRHDDELTEDDRNSLWSDLQLVMSDPNADLVPAKRKLIEIKLKKASRYAREIILDVIAKIVAERMKFG